MSDPILRVTYMEARFPPPPAPARSAAAAVAERIARERLGVEAYLTLYRRVGEPLRWDQRLTMPDAELRALLEGEALSIYVLRDPAGEALGFCEFDRSGFPDVELKNFGLITEAQGRGLGPWLLVNALREEWRSSPSRIWLHTDVWDHPAAVGVYERAGFRVFEVRDEPAGTL